MNLDMPDNGVDIAALLCSRLCHDLLSPVGAMNNGLELLADEHDPQMRQRCMDLLVESAKSAADKLKFFRLAFGAAGGFGSEVDPQEARSVIEPIVTSSGRTTLVWAVPPTLLPKKAVKVLLNLVLIANDALVRGGQLFVGAEKNGDGHEIVIRAEGPRIVFDDVVRSALSGELQPQAVDSRTAAAWMVMQLARENGGAVLLGPAEEGQLLIGARVE
jgi:histidine phosphotransferase ChpT